jgi:arylsulfatase A-like enzyme
MWLLDALGMIASSLILSAGQNGKPIRHHNLRPRSPEKTSNFNGFASCLNRQLDHFDSRTTMNLRLTIFALLLSLSSGLTSSFAAPAKPNIIFVMADDMGWGQTGYRGHPVLKTPNLDAMAAGGLRFERFYAGAPVCSPTRASVLTGRTNDRTGVLSHGYALRLQEKTIAQALQAAGYVTGHFGKWHLSGFRGPGAPILADDPRRPSAFGFDEWVSVSNFFDQNPLMSRAGKIEEFSGDSSEIAVSEAVKFLEKHRDGGKPMFAVIWYGTPHSPFKALASDESAFGDLNEASANHYGELVAMDRSLGTLRKSLRDLGIADNTLLVFCSDNGGLPGIQPETVGGLRGNKGSVFEGGLRVPGIVEWPAVIRPRVTNYPACTMDLFPTVADLLGLPANVFIQPVDGISLKPLFTEDLAARTRPISFRYGAKAALVDNRYKLLTDNLTNGRFELYDLESDPHETRDQSAEQPQRFEQMKQALLAWNASVEASFAGKDYPERKLVPADPEPRNWYETPQYQPYLSQWKERWEYQSYFGNGAKAKTKKGGKKKQ